MAFIAGFEKNAGVFIHKPTVGEKLRGAARAVGSRLGRHTLPTALAAGSVGTAIGANRTANAAERKKK